MAGERRGKPDRNARQGGKPAPGGRTGGKPRRSGGRSDSPKRSDAPKRSGAPSRRGVVESRDRSQAKPENTGGFGPFTHEAPPRRPRRGPDDEPGIERPKAAGLRIVHGKAQPKRTAKRRTVAQPAAPPRRRSRKAGGSPDVKAEIVRLGGRKGARLYEQVVDAADAFAHERNRVAVRILEPVRDAVPGSPSVRELLGLSHYRLGNYRAAAKELDKYVSLTASADQHPVLMDCERALGHHKRVEELWAELAAVSPSSELVAEGRIVRAGDLADQGQIDKAIAVLSKRTADVKRPKEHHLRLWYALADLEERAGNTPRARELFRRIEQHDKTFADVAERLSGLR